MGAHQQNDFSDWWLYVAYKAAKTFIKNRLPECFLDDEGLPAGVPLMADILFHLGLDLSGNYIFENGQNQKEAAE